MATGCGQSQMEWSGYRVTSIWTVCLTLHCPLQLILPGAITPRERHSAVAIGSGSNFRTLVLFGGWDGKYLSETTLLLLG